MTRYAMSNAGARRVRDALIEERRQSRGHYLPWDVIRTALRNEFDGDLGHRLQECMRTWVALAEEDRLVGPTMDLLFAIASTTVRETCDMREASRNLKHALQALRVLPEDEE